MKLWSDTNPWAAGFLRGLLLAIIGAVVVFLTNVASDDTAPSWAIAAVPMGILVLRSLEAVVLDQFRSVEDRMTPDK